MSEETGVDEVGYRLAEARKRVGLTQTQLGEALRLDKAQVSKIESGRRRLDISEVAAAAVRLGTTTRELLGMRERSKLALAARLATDAPDDALRQAQTRARHIVEVDDVLSEATGLRSLPVSSAVDAIRDFGRELTRRQGRSVAALQEQGRELAERTRDELDLGSDSLGDLPDLIETYFGVDVALSPMRVGADGLCVHGDDVRLILANSEFTPGHIRFTLAHELGHHLFGDPREVIGEDHNAMFARTPTESRANAFAANFLMPGRGIRAHLESLGEVSAVSPAGVVALLLHFQVSLQAVTYRLQNLGLLSGAQGDDLRSRSVVALIRAYAGEDTARDATTLVGGSRPPSRLRRAAVEAFANRQIGMGPIASLLERPDDGALFDELLGIPEVGSAFGATSPSRELVV